MTDSRDGQQVVVVGVDGSEDSLLALRWARRYADSTGAAVRAVLAWHYPAAAGVPPVGVAPAPVRQETESQMRRALDAAIEQVYGSAEGPGLEGRLSYGHPAEALIEESKDADLLVVGNRGHGAFTGMLLGSVSIHCVTNANCPVTVVRGS